MNNYFEYRNKFNKFLYKSYDVSNVDGKLKIVYHFEIPGLAEFHPSWIFNKSAEINNVIKKIAFYLGMVELISYWKLTCSPNVDILCGNLTEEEIVWWKKLYFDGLGEFFYVNGINPDFNDFISINSMDNKILSNTDEKLNFQNNKVIIPVGGGKDSCVTMELIKDMDYFKESIPFAINPRGAVIESINVSEYKNSIFVERKLDEKLFELNKKGFLNGHTPFSAIVAFSSILSAYINGYNYVALSNESSANESTVSGTSINHQYSKSYEFETNFFDYEEKYIGSGVKYFSILRGFSEYQIANLFSKYTKYYKIFKSCNVGSKEDIWCGKCPKCLFVCLILSPFLTRSEIINIFNADLLNDEDLKNDFDKLIGNTLEKPFECVGSKDEVNMAIAMTIVNFEQKKIELPKLLKYYKTTDVYKNNFDGKTFEEITKLQYEYKNHFNNENNIPEEILRILKEKIKGL